MPTKRLSERKRESWLGKKLSSPENAASGTGAAASGTTGTGTTGTGTTGTGTTGTGNPADKSGRSPEASDTRIRIALENESATAPDAGSNDPSRSSGAGSPGAGSPGAGSPSRGERTLRGYAREHPGRVALFVLMGLLALIGLLSVIGAVFGGEESEGSADASQEERPAQAPPVPGNPGEAGAALPRAEDVGAVRQDRDGRTVTVSITPSGGSYAGELSTEEDALFLESEENATQASFVSPFAEGTNRSWLGQIKDASEENLIVQATQTTDPGPAAREGRTPFMRGTYTVKARDGSLSTSGYYEDTFLAPTDIERTYTETYLASDTGATEPQHREWRVSYSTEGDPAFVPTLIGFEPPEGGSGG